MPTDCEREEMKIFADLAKAEQAYAEAKTNLDIARSNEIGATNRLNSAQKEFDIYVAKVRKTSPGGDWRQQEGEFEHAN